MQDVYAAVVSGELPGVHPPAPGEPFTPASGLDRMVLRLDLVLPVRSYRSRSLLEVHLAPNKYIERGNLKRDAGVPLCDGHLKAVAADVPGGVLVCEVCLERARRYDLPVPDALFEEARQPSSKRLSPSDPPVTYDDASRWFNYDFFMPFQGHLRRWGWLREHTVCATCGQPIASQRGQTRVLGQPLSNYRVCLNGCNIKDERDLIRKGQLPEAQTAPSGAKVAAGYGWLQTKLPEQEW